MRLGFTGTQSRLTIEQFDCLYELVKELNPSEAHHGDCIGADSILHAMCLELNIPVILHPPINPIKQAHCEGAHVVLEAKEYIIRNHDIVDESDIVIATPPTIEEIRRSGTWATWRYAKKTGKETYLIFPTGEIKHEVELK